MGKLDVYFVFELKKKRKKHFISIFIVHVRNTEICSIVFHNKRIYMSVFI